MHGPSCPIQCPDGMRQHVARSRRLEERFTKLVRGATLTARGSPLGGLKQFDDVARRIFHQDLQATRAAHDVVAEMHAGGPKSVHLN